MMTKNEKIITLVLNIISFALILAVVVPFGKETVSNGEIVFKCLIAPILACVIFVINSYIKYVVGTKNYKYNSFSAYLSIFGYAVALLMYLAIVSLRTGSGVVYQTTPWLVLTFFAVLGAGIIAVLGIIIHRVIIRLDTKENLFLDLAIFVLFVVLTALLKSVLGKHVGVAMSSNALQFIVVPLLLALAVIALLVFIMMNLLQYNEKFVYASRQELIDKWNEGRDTVYNEAKDDILFSLYLYTKEQLGIYDELDVCECDECDECEECEECHEAEAEEQPVEEPQEEAPAEEEQAEEEQAGEAEEKVSNEENEKRLAELLKQKEELTAVEEEPEEEVKEELPPKEFKPLFSELVKLAMSLEDVTYQGNSEGTNYKFTYKKKVFLILADTPKDYRLTFLMDLPEAAEFSQLVAFAKAKSPKGDYYFKLVNKGEFEPEQLFKIIRDAHDMVDVLAERARIAKEEEKARKAAERLQAKIDAMTPEERAAYYARLEKKRLAEEKKAQKLAEEQAKAEAEANGEEAPAQEAEQVAEAPEQKEE